MRTGSVVIGLCVLSLSGCDAPAERATPAAATEQPATPSLFADRSPGTHIVTGVLLAFEDAGFPMYSLEVGPAGSAIGDPTNLQLLALDKAADGAADPAVIQPMVGKAVEVRYSVAADKGMIDIQRNGASVLVPVEGQAPPAEDSKTITGVLSGADGESGDLPSTLTVTASDGTAVSFEAFIEPGMSSANGQTVTLKYVDGLDVQLVAITPAT
jgi:hypothetical protein